MRPSATINRHRHWSTLHRELICLWRHHSRQRSQSNSFEYTLQQIGIFCKKWTLHINFTCKKGRHFWKTCAPLLLLNIQKLLWWVPFMYAVLEFNKSFINCLQIIWRYVSPFTAEFQDIFRMGIWILLPPKWISYS